MHRDQVMKCIAKRYSKLHYEISCANAALYNLFLIEVSIKQGKCSCVTFVDVFATLMRPCKLHLRGVSVAQCTAKLPAEPPVCR
jgi:hypothetical protein